METEQTQKSDTITIKKDSLWKYSTFVLLGLIVLGVAFFVLPGKSPTGNVVQQPGQNLPTEPTAQVQVNIDGDPVKGDSNAKVTLVVFDDDQCPFCRKLASETLAKLEPDIQAGDVKIVNKNFPLGFHEGAIPYAKAKHCAFEIGGDEAYFKMSDKILEEQNALDGGSVRSTIAYVGDSTLKQWASEIGYNIASCFDSDKYEDEIQQDSQYGSQIGVEGTPATFVNGRLISGACPLATFKSAIEAELNNKDWSVSNCRFAEL